MVKFKSNYTMSELIARWDEHTSISRFAGSDETMDLIYISKRRGDNVRLIRKAPLAHEPFSTVFRGRIRSNKDGSEIVGCFTKSILDYIIIVVLFSVLLYIRSFVLERGDNPQTINSLIVILVVVSIFCLYNFRSTKRKYADFICRITGKENEMYLSKSEMKESDD